MSARRAMCRLFLAGAAVTVALMVLAPHARADDASGGLIAQPDPLGTSSLPAPLAAGQETVARRPSTTSAPGATQRIADNAIWVWLLLVPAAVVVVVFVTDRRRASAPPPHTSGDPPDAASPRH